MRNIVLNQITLCADGSIGVQLLKQIIDNGEVLLSEPHRTVVDPFGTVADQMDAVNTHLASMGFPPVEADGIAHMQALRSIHDKLPAVKARKAALKVERDAAAKVQDAADKVAAALAVANTEPRAN